PGSAGGLAKFDSYGIGRAPGVGVCFVPPHPNPLPKESEGGSSYATGKFGGCGCSHRFCVFRFGGARQPSSAVLPKHARMFLPLLGERAGVRGNRTSAVLAASALDSAPENRPKDHMALSHSLIQASGFAGGR